MPFLPADEDDYPTLGWDVIAYGQDVLVHPDGDKRGQSWTWTDDQRRYLLEVYRLDPLSGQRVYRRGCLIRPKKWGKGPFSAAICLCEASGPVRFAGWDSTGQVVAAPVMEAPRLFGGGWTPLIEVLGTSEDQTGNIWRPLSAMLDHYSAATGLGVDPGMTRMLLNGGAAGLIKPVTAGATSREGEPVTHAACDETWAWVKTNGGLNLAAVIRRNVGGTSGWINETTNAPAIGTGSVAENTMEAVQTKHVTDVYLDWREPSGEPPEREDRAGILRELVYVYGDHSTTAGGWVVPERQLAEVFDPDTSWEDALRFYMNRRSTAGGSWLGRDEWMRCASPKLVETTDLISVGFDGSKGESENADHTTLMGCRVNDGHLFVLEHFRPVQMSDGSWQISQSEVNDAVHRIFATRNVWRMYADPPYFGPWLAAWSDEWPDRVVSVDTTKSARMSPAYEALHTQVTAGLLTHDGNEALADHVGNAVVKLKGSADAPLRVISKEFPMSTRKIDLAVTAALAWMARTDAVAAGASRSRRPAFVGGF